MLETGSPPIDAQRAFARAARLRRRGALLARLRVRPPRCLPVYDARSLARAARRPQRRILEIPLCSIAGTLEPSRAAQFDRDFRPAPIARRRWERIWLAEHRGAPLPPIAVVPVADGFAVRDGHHRVSVARARGALTIDATVEADL
jgi:hypothetical protein